VLLLLALQLANTQKTTPTLCLQFLEGKKRKTPARLQVQSVLDCPINFLAMAMPLSGEAAFAAGRVNIACI
jgi:hypothetical protein